MGINTKIARIPFFILYLVLAGLVSFNWARVVLFQKNFEVFRASQPWDYYLSSFFSSTFGISHRQYFIFALPVVLISLYLIPNLIGRLLGLDRNSNIKGSNHVAAIIILLLAPATLGLDKFFGHDWKSQLIPGLILISLFSIWSWIDEQKAKKNI